MDCPVDDSSRLDVTSDASLHRLAQRIQIYELTIKSPTTHRAGSNVTRTLRYGTTQRRGRTNQLIAKYLAGWLALLVCDCEEAIR